MKNADADLPVEGAVGKKKTVGKQAEDNHNAQGHGCWIHKALRETKYNQEGYQGHTYHFIGGEYHKNVRIYWITNLEDPSQQFEADKFDCINGKQPCNAVKK